jgi:hypothetical protein
MDLIKCPQCGSQFPEGTKKCPVCDFILDESGYYEEEQNQAVLYDPLYGMGYEEDPVQNGSTGLSIAAMVLGIVSIVLGCLFIGILPGIIGLILGIVAIAKDKPGKGMAIAGVVTSAVGIVFFILEMVILMSISI